MIEIAAIDVTAEARQRLVARIDGWLRAEYPGNDVIPRASIRSVSPDELPYQSCIDLCVLGPELLAIDLGRVSMLRSAVDKTPFIGVTDARTSSLSVVDQLARLGIEDVLRDDLHPWEFGRRLVLFGRRKSQKPPGHLLLVEAGKGGAGVTTVVAALGEGLALSGFKTVLVDGDTESQDLARFLQVKPFVNEPLDLLFAGQRALTSETLFEAARAVWADESNLRIVSPPSDSLVRGSASHYVAKHYTAMCESLRGAFDVVVVDTGNLAPAIVRALLGDASHAIVVFSGDPACLPATALRANGLKSHLSARTEGILLYTGSDADGLSAHVAFAELERILSDGRSRTWAHASLTHCRAARQWPGSGRTAFAASRRVRRDVLKLVDLIGKGASLRSPEAVPSRSMLQSLHFAGAALKKLIPAFRRIPGSDEPKTTLPIPWSAPAMAGSLVSSPQFQNSQLEDQ